MTQEMGTTKRLMQFNALFLELDENEQDAVLMMLQSLRFAQSVMQSAEQPRQPPQKTIFMSDSRS